MVYLREESVITDTILSASYNRLKGALERVFMRFCELREKNVVNIKNGKNLGRVCDLKMDCCCGKIHAIVVPGPCRICCIFGSSSEYIIPFECIIKIGPDAILVDICEEKYLVSKD